mgnify:CR=1 FL=1
MTWLIVAILSYFLLAVVFLLDKYLLAQRIPDPKVYAFSIGLLSILILVIIPFVGFTIPETKVLIISLLTGAIFVLALFWFFKALRDFEASRVVPTVGALSPIFTLILFYFFSEGKETLSSGQFLAFSLLVIGTVLILKEKGKFISLKSFKLSFLAAFLFSLYFVLLKYVYLVLSFWQGTILTRIGGFLMALLFFLAFKEVRQEVFKKRTIFNFPRVNFIKSTLSLFFLARIGSGVAGLLQLWAVFLAPLYAVAIINALQGTQYLFLFFLTLFLSLKSPQILKEEVSSQTILQKILGILLISFGIAILTLF